MDFSSFILEQFQSLAMTVSVWQSGDDEAVNFLWERIRDKLGAKILGLMLISLTMLRTGAFIFFTLTNGKHSMGYSLYLVRICH